MDRVKLNMSGTYFEFDRKILKEEKCSKLTKLCSENSRPGKPLEITIDRSPFSFGAILDYCQTGELHIPTGICPGAFRREMEFWEVDIDSLSDCCLYRYQTFLIDEETRRQFVNKALRPTAVVDPLLTSRHTGILQRGRAKLWRIIDNNENSIPARLYFILVSVFVLLSICVLAISTEPSMRRSVSKCELLEYLESKQHKDLYIVKEILGNPTCEKGSLFTPSDWDDDDLFGEEGYDWSYYKYSWGWTTQPQHGGKNPQIPPEMEPTYFDYDAEVPEKIKIDIPHLTVPKGVFNILDVIVNVFFTIDFILRISSCPSLRRYFKSVINILDALALLSTYIYIVIVSVKREYLYQKTSWLMLLEFAQVFRALRLFRVVKNVRASKVLGYSLLQDLRDMSLLVTLLFVGICTFAYLFYLVESRDTVVSIPNAWYWAVVTMTTVGYGDITPKSELGRTIASLCAICGVLLLSVTLPMFVNNFLTLYQYSCVNESIEKRKKENRINNSGRNVSASGRKTNSKVMPVCIRPEEPPAYAVDRKTGQNTEWYHVNE